MTMRIIIANSPSFSIDDSGIRSDIAQKLTYMQAEAEEQATMATGLNPQDYVMQAQQVVNSMGRDFPQESTNLVNLVQSFVAEYETAKQQALQGDAEVLDTIEDKLWEAAKTTSQITPLNRGADWETMKKDLAIRKLNRGIGDILWNFSKHVRTFHQGATVNGESLKAYENELNNEFAQGLEKVKNLEAKILSFCTSKGVAPSFTLKLSPAIYEDKGSKYDDPDIQLTINMGGEMMPPSVTLFPDGTGGYRVDDVLEFGDTDFFETAEQSSLYFELVDFLRSGVLPGQGPVKFIKLYRGMSPKEMDAWRSGEIIPAGKFFTSKPTSQMAQDIPGEFPELYTVRVRSDALVQSDENVFQTKMPTKMVDGKIIPV